MSATEVRGYGVTRRPVETMALLVARLRDAARQAERAPLQRELTRIADELTAVRKAVMDTLPEAPGGEFRKARDGSDKNPEPGMRRCSRCGLKLPLAMFTVTDARTGKRRADCKECYNGTQRSRYVRVGFKVVTVEVLDGDPCVGHLCPVCDKAIEAGQHIQGDNVRHALCAAPDQNGG